MMLLDRRFVVSCFVSVAVIAAVACLLSANNETALQEVGFPARNVAFMQPQMRPAMDYVAVEKAAGAALDRDVNNFLMRRAKSTRAAVMHKRMAEAQQDHRLAPTQQLVATMHDAENTFNTDPAFALGNLKDPGMDVGGTEEKDVVFATWMQSKLGDGATGLTDGDVISQDALAGLGAKADAERKANQVTAPGPPPAGTWNSYGEGNTGAGLSWSEVYKKVEEGKANLGGTAPAPPASASLTGTSVTQEVTAAPQGSAVDADGEVQGSSAHAMLLPRQPSFGDHSQSHLLEAAKPVQHKIVAPPQPNLQQRMQQQWNHHQLQQQQMQKQQMQQFQQQRKQQQAPVAPPSDPNELPTITATQMAAAQSRQAQAPTAHKDAAVQLAQQAMAKAAASKKSKIQQLHADTARKERKYKKAMQAVKNTELISLNTEPAL